MSIILKEQGTPSAPSATYITVFSESGVLKTIDSVGNVSVLTSSGGGASNNALTPYPFTVSTDISGVVEQEITPGFLYMINSSAEDAGGILLAFPSGLIEEEIFGKCFAIKVINPSGILDPISIDAGDQLIEDLTGSVGSSTISFIPTAGLAYTWTSYGNIWFITSTYKR